MRDDNIVTMDRMTERALLSDVGAPRLDTGSNDALVNIVEECAQRLRELNGVTENDFLFTGQQLDAILSRVNSVSQISMRIASSISGDEIKMNMEGLRHSLDAIEDVFAQSQQNMRGNADSLSKTLGLVTAASDPLSSFAQTVKHLRIFGVATKIESARIQSADNSFYLLAEDVERLSHVIHGRSGDISKGLSHLQASIETRIATISSLKEREYVKTQKTIDRIGSILSELSEKRSLSAKTAQVLVDQSKDISQAISDVVASLQFHDITRQQIEHVVETLEEVRLLGIDQETTSDEILDMISRVADLQIKQLANAKGELLSAVERVIDELRGVENTIADMSKETKAILGITAGSSLSVVTEIMTSLSAVLAFFAENANTEKKASEALKEVSQTIDELSEFTTQIEEIGSEIELIALNAQIKAARTDGDGDALGVIAKAIAGLSEGAKSQTSAVTTVLNGISSFALDRRAVKEGAAIDAKVKQVAEEATQLSESAKLINESAALLIKDLERETDELTRQINAILVGITAHVRADSAIRDVIERLNSIAVESCQAAPETKSKKVKEYLDSVTDRYTMIQERQVHRSYTKDPDNSIGHDGLGDNVELF